MAIRPRGDPDPPVDSNPPVDRGQATVELVLALPFVAIALLLVVQVLLVAQAQLAVEHAAREAARIAAVDPDPAAATAAALRGALPAAGTTVRIERSESGQVTAVVEHRLATTLPIVGGLVPDLDLRGEASFRAEWQPP